MFSVAVAQLVRPSPCYRYFYFLCGCGWLSFRYWRGRPKVSLEEFRYCPDFPLCRCLLGGLRRCWIGFNRSLDFTSSADCTLFFWLCLLFIQPSICLRFNGRPNQSPEPRGKCQSSLLPQSKKVCSAPQIRVRAIPCSLVSIIDLRLAVPGQNQIPKNSVHSVNSV